MSNRDFKLHSRMPNYLFFRLTRLMASEIYDDYSEGYHSPFKVSHRSRFFRVLLKLTSAEWTQVQSTALETLMRLR